MRGVLFGLVLLAGWCGTVNAQTEVDELVVAVLILLEEPATAAREEAVEARERLEAEFAAAIKKLPEDAPDIQELEKQRAGFLSAGVIPTHPRIRKDWDRYLKEVAAAEKRCDKRLDEIAGYGKRNADYRELVDPLIAAIRRAPLIPGIAGILSAWAPKREWREVVEAEPGRDGKAAKPIIWTVRSRDDYRIVLERPASHVRGIIVLELTCDKDGGVAITDVKLTHTPMKIEVAEVRGSGTILAGSLEFEFEAKQRKAGTEDWETWGPMAFKLEPHVGK